MSTLKIRIANFFAKQSCSAWQSNRVIRNICRKVYRTIMELGATSYPYARTDFAGWPESDGELYTLITDSANFVIRHSPSYMAWLMKKHCGGWPKLPVPGERKPGEHNFDAKHWDEVLEFNGWQRVSGCYEPKMSDAINDTHFIGVIADEGEFGQVVWFNGVDMAYDRELDIEYVDNWDVSTYKDFQRVDYLIPASEKSGVVWYREPIKGRHWCFS